MCIYVWILYLKKKNHNVIRTKKWRENKWIITVWYSYFFLKQWKRKSHMFLFTRSIVFFNSRIFSFYGSLGSSFDTNVLVLSLVLNKLVFFHIFLIKIINFFQRKTKLFACNTSFEWNTVASDEPICFFYKYKQLTEHEYSTSFKFHILFNFFYMNELFFIFILETHFSITVHLSFY